MATDGFTETGLGIVLRPGAPVARGASGRPAARHARRAGASARTARRLEDVLLILAMLAVGIGAFLYTYGITLALTQETDSPYPNVQHVSVTPAPRLQR